MKFLLDDPEFDAQLQRAAAKAYERGADLGECVVTARRIRPGDYDSWYQEWWTTAERAREAGEASLVQGRRASAREAFLRATEYYRSAYYFCRRDLEAPPLLAAWRQTRACFCKAAALFDHPCEAVEVPYQGTTLSGYFLAPDRSGASRLTVVCPCGYDCPVEEVYFFAAAPALRRGYNCLIFEGPGQGGSLYEKRLFFRPDYEVVLSAVVDYALTRREADPARLVLVGRSFGGYLAPRAATGEHRFAALVADPGQMGLGVQMRGLLPADLLEMIERDDPAADAVLGAMLQDPHQREFYGARMAAHGAGSMREWLRMLRAYTLEGRERLIRCPTLIVANDADPTAGTARQPYDALECPKHFVRFGDEQGAGGHCEGLGQLQYHQVVFDWLDEALADC